LLIECDYERTPTDARQLTGNVLLLIQNTDVQMSHEVTVRDHAYGAQPIRQTIAAGGDRVTRIVLDTRASRVETGADGISDPCMGESRKTS